MVGRWAAPAVAAMVFCLGCWSPAVADDYTFTSGLPPAQTSDEFQRGVALGAYFRDEGRAYESYLWEMRRAGADSVSLVVAWSQQDVRSTEIAPAESRTARDEDLRRTIQFAREMGLRVMLFPILHVEERSMGEWRGRLQSTDVDAWWASYRHFVTHYARIAAEEGASVYSVGSELSSTEIADEARWRELIAEVRTLFDGQLIYSANWDHFDRTPFWDAVDLFGVSAYYELTEEPEDPTDVDILVDAWGPVVERLVAHSQSVDRPIVLTELGYASQHGAAAHPWNYTHSTDVDLGLQMELYAAAFLAWRGRSELAGVYFWTWFGDGGATDSTYCPRQKPVEQVIQHWFALP